MDLTDIRTLKNFFRFTLTALLIFGASSCSTKKNTLVTRSYHNLTSHYNIYFNAWDSYLVGIKKVQTSFKDDYNSPLPLFPSSTREGARMVLSDMDKTVKKCSKVIGTHSITAKPKIKRANRTDKQKEFYRQSEFVKWVDDAFLLMGKAYYLKHDFMPAVENFEYILRQYPDGGLTDEASLWLARTYLALKKYPESQQVLNRLQGTPGFSKKLISELNAVNGDWYLRQDDISSAIPFLEKAVADYPEKVQRTRICYVLAQLYEKSGNPEAASGWYERVNELNPPYDMAFNARINRARLYQGGEEAAAAIRKELMKMLRDEKNIDYLDQVYFALAEIDMKEGKEESAILNYKKSVWSNTTNATQKAMSYLALAKHYYDSNDFIPAGAYYDSCGQSLPETYPDYVTVTSFGEDVTLLAENLKIAIREDSLQEVAKLPEADREKLIASRMEEAQRIEDELKAKQEEEKLAMQSGRGNSGMMGGMGGQSSLQRAGTRPGSAGQEFDPGGAVGMGDPTMQATSSWYFYNPAAASFGMSEFIKMWGRRKLEDNWRRSNKKILSEAGDLSEEGESGEISTPAAGTKTNTFKPTQREFYLAELPLNDTLMGESNTRVAQALFNAGKIFKDELKRPDEAIQYFEMMNSRFPKDERILFSYYNLYQIYEGLKSEDLLKKYKDLILSNFPESRSAKIISNPNYFKELDEARAKVMSFYETVYSDYQGKEYKKVVDACDKADTAFSTNPIRDKFGLLRIMAYAKTNPADTAGLVKSLNDLMFKYPESEVAEPAKNLLSYIQNGPSSAIGKTSRKLLVGRVETDRRSEEDVEYFPDEAATHYYVVVVSAAAVDIGRLKFRISNFNVEKFDAEVFEVASSILEGDLQAITVKNFNNGKEGMSYFEAITADPAVFAGMKDTDYRQFLISKDNYTRFYKNKNVFQYIQFFQENYLKQ
jgi:tetratricopeptide (TPR) repeat protein